MCGPRRRARQPALERGTVQVGRIAGGPLRRVGNHLIELVGDQAAAAAPYFADFMGGLAALLEGYSDEQLRTIADFSTRAARIQQEAAGRLVAP